MVEAAVAYVQIDLVTQNHNLLVTKEKHITTFNRWWRKTFSILSGYPSGKIFKYHEPSARFQNEYGGEYEKVIKVRILLFLPHSLFYSNLHFLSQAWITF